MKRWIRQVGITLNEIVDRIWLGFWVATGVILAIWFWKWWLI